MSSASQPQDDKHKLDEPNLDEIIAETRGRAMRLGRLYTLPYWLMFLVFVGILLGISIVTDEIYAGIFEQLVEGIGMTVMGLEDRQPLLNALGQTARTIMKEALENEGLATELAEAYARMRIQTFANS